jgi:hypothetical protein
MARTDAGLEKPSEPLIPPVPAPKRRQRKVAWLLIGVGLGCFWVLGVWLLLGIAMEV